MTNVPDPSHPPTFHLREVRISTQIQLNPAFVKSPKQFARNHAVDLVGDALDEFSWKKSPESSNDVERKRIKSTRKNVHLVRYGAIRLFADEEGDAHWIRSIELNPSMLIHGVDRCSFTSADWLKSLSMLRQKVAPLLADTRDSVHIVPGLVDTGEPTSYWSEVDAELLLPGTCLRCLHDLNHPATGPAEGNKDGRIQLGEKKDPCLVRFKSMKVKTDGANGSKEWGTRVRLVLQSPYLAESFAPHGKTGLVKDALQLLSFPASGLVRVHETALSRIEGYYLPKPTEWKVPTSGKRVTHAKVISLLSHLTSLPVEELRAIDEQRRKPDKSTIKRLTKDLALEADRLAPVPASTLFRPDVYQKPFSALGTVPSTGFDPLVRQAYGTP